MGVDDPYPDLDNPPARCPICRRTTHADMLLDVRALPSALRGEADYACDGCRERWLMTGAITHMQLYRSLGAPPEVLDRVRGYVVAMAPHSQAAAAELQAMEDAGDTS
jgi:hypothetical protein